MSNTVSIPAHSAYKYNPETFEYEGEQNCQLDPIATQKKSQPVYLLSANCTYLKPFNPKEGFDIVWNSDKDEWEYADAREYTPYTVNEDNSINILGDKGKLRILKKKYSDVDFKLLSGEPYYFRGKTYVSEDAIPEEVRIEGKRQEFIRQYEADKAELIRYIATAVAYGDSIDELRDELLALDEQFDTNMEALKKMG